MRKDCPVGPRTSVRETVSLRGEEEVETAGAAATSEDREGVADAGGGASISALAITAAGAWRLKEEAETARAADASEGEWGPAGADRAAGATIPADEAAAAGGGRERA